MIRLTSSKAIPIWLQVFLVCVAGCIVLVLSCYFIGAPLIGYVLHGKLYFEVSIKKLIFIMLFSAVLGALLAVAVLFEKYIKWR